MRILVTNDDGIDAPGLHALALAACRLSDDVIVIAPSDERSGSGAALGPVHLASRIACHRAAVPGCSVEAYAIDGPPALAVLVAARGAYGDRPDLVLSGINPGLNTGNVLIHSGTVGAVLTAGNNGIPGVAVSIDTPADGGPPKWATAAAVAEQAARVLLSTCEQAVLNINVPDLDPWDVEGIRDARLARFGSVRATFTTADEGALDVEFRADAEPLSPGSDLALVKAGYIAVTSVTGPQRVPVSAATEWLAASPLDHAGAVSAAS